VVNDLSFEKRLAKTGECRRKVADTNSRQWK
jgi:hypothetical protein